ncbi:MAG: IS66 family transposase [Legionellales bacterium]|nr:IS66 family transposase [Legionellales bacterium]
MPYRRTKLLFKAIYNHNISVCTVDNAVNYIAERLSNIESQIKELLKKAPALHADETGTNVTSSKHWLHVASADKLTHYGIQAKRGSVAMNDIGILPDFTGTMVHDHWSSYYVYENATHAMCNAHILRELKFIHEYESFKWAGKMTDLLYDMKKSKDIFLQSSNASPPIEIKELEERNSNIITAGRREQALRGTNNSKKLLKRLTEYRDNILLFLHDIIVPFTNNVAERDIRMEKVRLKISGGFRTLKGAKDNCTIKSVLSTGNKNNKNHLEILVLAFQEQLNINLLADL